MYEIYERLGTHIHEPVEDKIFLTHEQRERGRIRTESEQGKEVRIFLERGQALLVGEYLRSQCGKNIKVEGAVEQVATATCDDWALFSRACYHLGNRHVKIQVGERRLSITPDHVLEEMLQQLGLTVEAEQVVFVPESGAYKHERHEQHHHHE
ncbi:MAG: urease accessory protein UreE [Alteromonadaceae bacterium]|nr:MAG: urease accessory protein UreE [Alteromonadaceae bacterium]